MKTLLALLVAALVFPAIAKADPEVGKPVDVKFTSVDGKDVDLAKLKGKVVLVDFWATWCPPCRAEVPDVVATYQKYHSKGFDVVGISLDQDKGALQAFTKQNDMTWPQYFESSGSDNKFAVQYGVPYIPTMWLIGKDGNLLTTNARDDLAGQVEKALGK